MTVLELGNGRRVFCVVGEERRGPLPPCKGALVQVDDGLGAEIALARAHAGCRIFVLFGASAAETETQLDWVLQDQGDELEDVATATVDSFDEALDLILSWSFPESADIVVALVSDRIEELRGRLTRP